MIDISPIRRMLILCLSLSIVACSAETATQTNSADPALDDPAAPTPEAISPTEAESEPEIPAAERSDQPSDGAEANASETNISEAKGGDPALLIGKWEPIAYVRPDGVEMDLVELPKEERADLSWEFGEDGSVEAGSSIGTVEFQDTTFIATNKATGEARTFRYTVTDTNLFVINPAGDVLKLQRAQ
ncbi:MAG: hypothetical protein HC795_01515 [Coleofasciculaceae cyanobacterium RL_1_1]|nr:hypothetical protein [Coleofasciculaceae cyanobacterium RL_1_1]